jgi:hypothetical protein
MPSREDVLAALGQLRIDAGSTGRRPSAISLARHFGLANTTFRRHFPDIAGQLTAATTEGTPDHTDPGHLEVLRNDLARLRQHNRHLHDHLELAIANIQRLTTDNHHLRQHLEAAQGIRHLPNSKA